MTEGEAAGILLLAPVLLLLAQDPLLLRFLEERRRYVPPLAAVMGYLAGAALWQLADDAMDLPAGRLDGRVAAYMLKQLGCLAAALPAPLMLLAWLWSKAQARAGGGRAACVAVRSCAALPCFQKLAALLPA